MLNPSATSRSEEPGRSEDPPEIDESTTLRSGSRLGRYVVLFRVGGGGMGVVYAAYDPQLDRKIALKVVRPKAKARRRSRAHQRLLREAQVLAKLSHPNVVAIHDVGVIESTQTTDGDPDEPLLFVAMDFVEGLTLRRWLQQTKRSQAEILEKFLQAAEGLAAAHEAGVVHRDFKPDNAIVGKSGRVQVLDFGLARVEQPTQPTDAPGARPGVDPPPLTIPKARIGTPGYMSPEQLHGESAGPAADQFAFCVSLYEALYRKAPFVGDDPVMLAENVKQGILADPPRYAKVSPKLRRVLLRGLAIRPEERHKSMRQLIDALAQRPTRARKRVVAIAAVGVLTTTAAWIYGGGTSDGSAKCPGAEERLAGIWDDGVRTSVASAFEKTGRRHAEETFDRLGAALDAWATLWLEAHQDACEATHVRHEQSEQRLDDRMLCLGRQLDAAAALTEVLVEADGEVVDRALQAVDALPAAGECASTEAEEPRAALPDDEHAREQIAEQEKRLAQVEALFRAGRSTEASDLAAAVVERARDLEYPPLLATSLLAHGLALTDAGRAEPAAEQLREAAVVAEREGNDRLSVRVRVALVGTVGDRLQRYDEARLWADLAAATLARIGGDPLQEAQLEHNLSLVADQNARPEDSLAHERKAVALLRSAGGSALTLAAYESHLAMTLGHLRRYHEALTRAEESKETWERLLGPDHPRAAVAESTLGLIYDYKGEYKQAATHYEAAFAMAVRAKGPESRLADEIHNNLAIVAAKLGDTDRAITAFEGILRQREHNHGPQSPQVASALHNLAAAESMLGKHDAALEHHERALAIRESLFGADDPQVVGSLTGIANVYETRGEPKRALPVRRRALEIETKRYGEDHAELLTDVCNLAHNEMLVGDLAAALATAERGLRIAQRNQVNKDSRAYARVVLARVLHERKEDPQRVASLVERAQEELGDLPAEATRRLIGQIKGG